MSAFPVTHPVDLQALHTFGLPAKALELKQINSIDDLQQLAAVSKTGQPHLLLGEGSNTVFLSPFLDATVWKMNLRGRQYLGSQDGFHRLRVMAGENWHHTVEWTVAMGWGGLENLALIPGSVGASPVQNIGAYGLELKDRIESVHVFDLITAQTSVLSVKDCGFGYRDSLFKQAGEHRYVITAVDFALPVAWQAVLGYGDVAKRVEAFGSISPATILRAICEIRSEKLPDPAVLGNCGSFFKNPVIDAGQVDSLLTKFPNLVKYPVEGERMKLAAGWLIEQCGLKGTCSGGVGVYQHQALILVNHGQGKAEHLLNLIQQIQQQVFQKFGVQLEPEPNLIFNQWA